MWPIILGVGSALCFGVQIALTGAAARRTSVEDTLWVQTTFVLVTAIVWAAGTQSTVPSTHAVVVLLVAGIAAPLIARTLFIYSITKLGSNVATPIVLSHPVVTVLLASTLLSEQLDGLGWVAVGMTLSGGLLVVTRPKVISQVGSRQDISPAFLALAVISAVASGSSLFLRKVGMNLGVSPGLAAFFTSIPAWLVYTGWLVVHHPSTFKGWQRFSSLELLGSGVAGSFGMVLWYTGIDVAQLSVFAPLGALIPVFALLVNFFLYREQETFSLPVVCGTFLSMAGAGLIAYSSQSIFGSLEE